MRRIPRRWRAAPRSARRNGGQLGPHLSGEEAEPLLGDGRHQLVLVAKVPVGRRVADPRQLGRRPQGQAANAPLPEQLEARLDEGGPQIPVLVGVGPLAGDPDRHASSVLNVDGENNFVDTGNM